MRRFLRFRLSTLLLDIVCLAMALAWWRDRQTLRLAWTKDREALLGELEDAKVWRQVLSDAGSLRGPIDFEEEEENGRNLEHFFAVRTVPKELGIEFTKPNPALLEKAVGLLDDELFWVRAATTACLRYLQTPENAAEIVRHLTRLLDDRDLQVRREAVEGLVQSGAPSAIGILEKWLATEKDPYMIVALVDALGRLESSIDFLPTLGDLLKQRGHEVRYLALRQLNRAGRRAPERAVVLALPLLASDEWWVRVEAAAVVGNLGQPSDVPILLQAYRQEAHFYARPKIAGALMQLEAKR